MRTWIAKGTEAKTVKADDFWYGEWFDHDRRFLDEMRRVSAAPHRAVLLQDVLAVGWGEEVTHSLPQPVKKRR